MLISDSVHFLSLKPTRTLCHCKFYPLAIFQRTIAIALDGTVVDEDVATCITFNKTITLVIIEPLYSTHFAFCHGYKPPTVKQTAFPIKTCA